MKCNLECPYSKPNGRDTNGNQSIICESRKWFMTDADECIEKFDEKTISNLKNIYGDGAMPKEKFRVFTELPTNEKMIVNMITDEELTLEDACDLLNNQDQKIKELKRMLQLVSEAETDRNENSVKEIVRDKLFGLDSVAGESANAFNDYLMLNKFFKEYYNEHWDNDKFD